MIVQPVGTVSTVQIDTVPVQDTVAPAKPLYNKYGDLLRDDPEHNSRSSWIVPAVRALLSNVFVRSKDRYVFRYDWVATSVQDWKNNFKNGPEWDLDGFGVNFIGHPYAGSIYFDAARSNGYSY